MDVRYVCKNRYIHTYSIMQYLIITLKVLIRNVSVPVSGLFKRVAVFAKYGKYEVLVSVANETWYKDTQQ